MEAKSYFMKEKVEPFNLQREGRTVLEELLLL
jgi:hypothetical protein